MNTLLVAHGNLAALLADGEGGPDLRWKGLFLVLLIVVSIFLILLVLVQRGRGGGLTGALGGMGGQSAFGAKAGDTFTKVTMWTALVWILLCIFVVKYLTPSSEFNTPAGASASPGTSPPAGTTGQPPAGLAAPKGPPSSPSPAGASTPAGGGAAAPVSKPVPATPAPGKSP